ncbi:RNA polymerase II transcription factor SIII subunit A-domain-containing protein [Amanita rubescens]|nr:RNA polymerase II transcription factor SIII subunit A-domain-containing protein [Amanita rubescens]
MPSDDSGSRRIPSLVSMCQRVAATHVDSITNLGPDICFRLAKPILERCSAEQLLQIEDASPQLQHETEELWMNLCSSKYPKMAQRYLTGEEDVPELWRDRYFSMQEAEARRLEELGSRLRLQRQEEAERKKEREVKITDRLPPPKRFKTGWGPGIPQPKSLFQKTRFDASKLQKAMYSTRMLPPMPASKNYTLAAKTSAPILLPPPPLTNGQPSRVTVNTVKRPLYSLTDTVTTAPQKPPLTSGPLSGLSQSKAKPSPCHAPNNTGAKQNLSTLSAAADSLPRPHVKTPRKDPMACLFLPKHRAFSQRPTKT